MNREQEEIRAEMEHNRALRAKQHFPAPETRLEKLEKLAEETPSFEMAKNGCLISRSVIFKCDGFVTESEEDRKIQNEFRRRAKEAFRKILNAIDELLEETTSVSEAKDLLHFRKNINKRITSLKIIALSVSDEEKADLLHEHLSPAPAIAV